MLAQSSTDKRTGPTGPTFQNRLVAALDAIDALFKDGLRCQLCDLYTLVYDIATHSGETESEYSAALFEEYVRRMHETQAGFAEAFEELLSECVSERVQCWLEKMVAVLEGQARFAYIFVHGFEYLDRVEFVELLSKPKLRQKAYVIYQDTKLKVLAGQTMSLLPTRSVRWLGKGEAWPAGELCGTSQMLGKDGSERHWVLSAARKHVMCRVCYHVIGM